MLSESALEEARQLRQQGLTWLKIANHLGVKIRQLRHAVDPGFTERMRELKEDYKERRILAKPPLLERDRLLERLRAGYR